MADLFDEMQQSSSAQPSVTGGDLFDEAGIDPSVVNYIPSEDIRRQALADLNRDITAGEAAMIAAGRTVMAAPRALGLAEPEPEIVTQAYRGLQEQRPFATAAGEALPFLAPGVAVGGIPSLGGRVAAGGLLGATEGAVLASAGDKDIATAAGIGGTIGAGAEVLFPVLGRLGRSVYQRVTGKAPKGALIDQTGRPTPEMQQALDEAGISFDDLVADAQGLIQGSKEGAIPEQVARAAMFAEEGVPITRGELTKDFGQQAVEQRLLQSASDKIADPFRQFKLRQSEAIRSNLESNLNTSLIPEETGSLIVDSLAGRKKLLRQQKNALYQEAADAARDIGGVPVMVDVEDIIPDQLTMRGLNRASGGVADDVVDTLRDFGLVPPTDEMIEAGFDPEQLTVKNFEDLRQTLKALERKDQTGATSKLVGPIIDTLDGEMDNLALTLEGKGYGSSVVEPLKRARETVRTLKTEFSPQSITGRLIDVKRDGVTPVVEASKVYDKLSGKAMPVENVRRTVSSLIKSGDKGKEALASLQATTMLDLINAGFGTKSRQIEGVQVFNPIAFRNRIESIGKDKLKAIFQNEPQAFNKLMRYEKIAKDLTTTDAAVPKGSASVLMDALNRLGIMAIANKMPGGVALIEGMRQLSEAGGNRAAVERALNASPDVVNISRVFDQKFPGIASAMGVSGYVQAKEEQ